MIKRVVVLVVLMALMTLGVLNLGRFLDVTQEPVKSDIIVCLGGGTIERVQKSITLLEQGLADKKLLLLGESWYNQPYIRKNHSDITLLIDESPKNTKEEVLFIKTYMKEHGYSSALIVTDPPHARRVRLLTSLLSTKGDEAMDFHLASSGVKWWNAEHYYTNKRAVSAAKNESLKLLYSVVAYGFLEKIGLLDEVEVWIKGSEK